MFWTFPTYLSPLPTITTLDVINVFDWFSYSRRDFRLYAEDPKF